MSTVKKMDQLTAQMENYLECWKQFNHYVNHARGKQFSAEDESQFLEIKSVLVQELEIILASIEINSPTKDEIHTLYSKLSAGGKADHPLNETFFGTFGDLTDKYGFNWMLQMDAPKP